MTIQPSILNWYNSLTTSTKYLYEDENATYDAITKEADFLSLLEVRQTLSTNLLRSTLQKKSRVVMFGAGGTASWFLPKLLKIYNDAFTKCPDLAYDLEIAIIDGDVIEQKNIIRQNFINEDIGSNKALKLAERYTGLYPHISVTAIPMYATSVTYDTEVSKLEEPLDPEFFFDIDPFLQRSDIIVNLVDNEVFKRKLDSVIFSRSCLLYFNAGINLFNGQCYVTYPRFTNLYTIDHPSFIEDVEEVAVHSCADADANGTADNPEQMFNGNDLAASILANLYQTALSEAVSHRKVKFVCGNNISITRELPTYSSILYALALNPHVDYPYEEAKAYVARYGTDVTTDIAQAHYKTIRIVEAYDNIFDMTNPKAD